MKAGILDWVAKEGISEEVTFEQRPDGVREQDRQMPRGRTFWKGS